MEKKKNNAVEKVENVSGGNKQKKTAKGSNRKKSVAPKKSVKKDAASLKKEKKEQKLAAKAEREKIRAEKRVELARLKAHKKAEKEKAKATALRERNRRIAEHKAKKEQIKAEKQRRRDMLKNESKKQREERRAAERARLIEERKFKREEKAKLKRERLEAKKQNRSEKRKHKQRNKERKKGFGGWLAAVISLGVATLVLASVLTFTFMMPMEEDAMLEATYQKSFYDTVEQVNNMDVNLSKALATSDKGALQNYLVDIAINSELAENDIQQLPLQDESKFYTTKVINQIGDYAKYLNKKIISGEELSEQDVKDLNRLYAANQAVMNALNNMMGQMGEDFSFSSMMNNDKNNVITDNFNELQNLSVEYPELIYDGPFSDGLDRKEIKGLYGAEISGDLATEIFSNIFGGMGLENIQQVGMTERFIKCYNVQGEKDGNVLFAQISVKGGKLIMFDYAGSCNDVAVEDDLAVEKALEFLGGLGIYQMKPVWVNLANNVYTINMAYSEQDVILYADLIKVRVCAETGMVIGMEAGNYYTNHTERLIPKATLSREEAEKKISSGIDMLTARLVVIPFGNSSEKLCYEFSGEYNGSTYYVYIDANSGRQVEMFKVINSTEGQLLI